MVQSNSLASASWKVLLRSPTSWLRPQLQRALAVGRNESSRGPIRSHERSHSGWQGLRAFLAVLILGAPCAVLLDSWEYAPAARFADFANADYGQRAIAELNGYQMPGGQSLSLGSGTFALCWLLAYEVSKGVSM